MPKKPFTWVVAFTVDPTWVADGFTLSNERAHDMLWRELGAATHDECGACVLSAPYAPRVANEQGYILTHPGRNAAIHEIREGNPQGNQMRTALDVAILALDNPALRDAARMKLYELRETLNPATIPE